MKRIAGTVLALLAVFASFGASALGLGQIEVKSKVGQPLVAEIPIISSDPTELEQLRAGLASPETFARIGLRPPIGIIAELQFTQALDARGNPIIRVTSTQPVSEPLLTFLVEVDWGQGRLVREYSALVDAPRTVSAPLQPDIAAPVLEAPAVIERPAEPTVATEEPVPPAEVPAAEPAPTETAAEPAPQDGTAIAPTEPQQPIAVATPVTRPVFDDNDYEVRRGDTLSSIASRVGGAGTLDQTMIALLRANPDAFIGGNINRLKAGAVLRMPGEAAMTELEAQQASAIVHSQTQEWRASRHAAPQPAGADAGAAATAQAATASTSTPSKRVADARLEIVPPGASDATKAGTQSGFSAGGEGAMLEQELTQTKETLAAREAEAEELKTRFAELEKLREQQQQLIAMKDSELKTILTTIVQYSKTADELKQNFAKWFDDYMDRVSGWYKSRQQVWLFIIGLLVAVVLNVDCFRLVKELNDNSVLREHMAQAAENYVSTHEPEVTGNDSLQMIVKNIKDAYNQLDVNDLPIGWNKTPTTGNPFAGFWSVNQTYFINGTWVQTISGWLITAGLLSFGSPFWFQLLNKLIDLRKAGKKPEQVNTTDQT